MVDDRGNTAVGIILGEFGSLLLTLLEVKVYRLVGQAELLKDKGDLPLHGSGMNTQFA